ncbi:hypothetical protein UFOVP306_22 [uncultured Caudovirales phage]|uniref:Uncharacterized protein n=1 Tax=uncultured Caudovirales phage TaxID=2100421 RepID=A0A6J5LXR1_9CAUD|nr:hypothetical protein UFOVP306_22 [uncultured Caudovirales phage]
MPLAKRDNGWYWGGKGPFPTKAKAQSVARAAYASGYSKQGNTMKFSVEKTGNDPVMQFVMCLLHSVTGAHILHLISQSYSQHKALETYYTEIGDHVDDFVEAFQGKYGLLTNFTSGFEPPNDALEYLTYLKEEVYTLRYTDGFPEDTELQNLTDEIAQLIDSTLYKLRFLK